MIGSDDKSELPEEDAHDVERSSPGQLKLIPMTTLYTDCSHSCFWQQFEVSESAFL
jgi:hypothetical protein